VTPIVEVVDAAALIDLRWRVLLPGRPRRDAHLAQDRDGRHWALRVGGALVGGVSVIGLRGLALRAMVIDPAWQRRGLGLQLLARVHADVAAPLWCNAREGVVGFYEAAGWRVMGPRFVIAGEGEHRRMGWSPGPSDIIRPADGTSGGPS
jgi:GNAT superfamily N-acetyltransferase